ncbi:MAG: hypothetical protein LBF64_01235 [Oscillospiraceae bacterium]|jgi:hypothetical protein|nr:hypothetical protein [Oscillospiraceae bacterium]
MRRILLACTLLAGLIGAGLWVGARAEADLGRILTLLDAGAGCADAGRRDEARAAVQAALSLWEARIGLFEALYPAADIEAVGTGLHRLRAEASVAGRAQYLADSAVVMAQLRALIRGHRPSLETVL